MSATRVTPGRHQQSLQKKTERQVAATRDAHTTAKTHVELGKQIVGLSLVDAVAKLGHRIAEIRKPVSSDAVETRLFSSGKLVDDPAWESVKRQKLSRNVVLELNAINKKEAARQKAKKEKKEKNNEAGQDSVDEKSIDQDDNLKKKQRRRRREILLSGMGNRPALKDTLRRAGQPTEAGTGGATTRWP